jgi:hypothetical protein
MALSVLIGCDQHIPFTLTHVTFVYGELSVNQTVYIHGFKTEMKYQKINFCSSQ